jgi:hypothetical protein
VVAGLGKQGEWGVLGCVLAGKVGWRLEKALTGGSHLSLVKKK